MGMREAPDVMAVILLLAFFAIVWFTIGFLVGYGVGRLA